MRPRLGDSKSDEYSGFSAYAQNALDKIAKRSEVKFLQWRERTALLVTKH